MPIHDLLEPFPLFGYGPVQPTPQLLLDGPELRPHAVAAGLPLKLEAPAARFAANEREPEEHEGLRFSEPALPAVGRSTAAKLNHTGLVRMERQHELLKPRTHRIKETSSVVLMLKANDQIIGIAHDDHVAGSLALSPALGPEVENIVEVDVAEE